MSNDRNSNGSTVLILGVVVTVIFDKYKMKIYQFFQGLAHFLFTALIVGVVALFAFYIGRCVFMAINNFFNKLNDTYEWVEKRKKTLEHLKEGKRFASNSIHRVDNELDQIQANV